jgi:hypothetical protein
MHAAPAIRRIPSRHCRRPALASIPDQTKNPSMKDPDPAIMAPPDPQAAPPAAAVDGLRWRATCSITSLLKIQGASRGSNIGHAGFRQ